MFWPDFSCILDQGQVIRYFCRISLVVLLVYYNYSNVGPECQASSLPSALIHNTSLHKIFQTCERYDWSQKDFNACVRFWLQYNYNLNYEAEPSDQDQIVRITMQTHGGLYCLNNASLVTTIDPNIIETSPLFWVKKSNN